MFKKLSIYAVLVLGAISGLQANLLTWNAVAGSNISGGGNAQSYLQISNNFNTTTNSVTSSITNDPNLRVSFNFNQNLPGIPSNPGNDGQLLINLTSTTPGGAFVLPGSNSTLQSGSFSQNGFNGTLNFIYGPSAGPSLNGVNALTVEVGNLPYDATLGLLTSNVLQNNYNVSSSNPGQIRFSNLGGYSSIYGMAEANNVLNQINGYTSASVGFNAIAGNTVNSCNLGSPTNLSGLGLGSAFNPSFNIAGQCEQTTQVGLFPTSYNAPGSSITLNTFTIGGGFTQFISAGGTISVNPLPVLVPEPSTFVMAGIACAFVGLVGRFRLRK
jgi:hypothetical protein